MGRPPVPNSVKEAKGTLKQSRTKSKVPATWSPNDRALSPEPPKGKGLKKEARVAWQVAIAEAPKGLLQVTDAWLLERWARTYAEYTKCAKRLESEDIIIEQIDSQGNVRTKSNPLFQVVVQLHNILLECEKQLGFTPASRARVSAAIPEEKEEDEFADF